MHFVRHDLTFQDYVLSGASRSACSPSMAQPARSVFPAATQVDTQVVGLAFPTACELSSLLRDAE
eukprot:1327927-Amphidinium_carterae.1